MGYRASSMYYNSEAKKSVTLDEYFEIMNKFLSIYDSFIFQDVDKSKKIKKKLKKALLEFEEYTADNPSE